MVTNPNFFGQSTTGLQSQIEDGIDFPHTGLLKALSTAASGRIPLTGFNITSPTTTSIPVSSGTILYDGRVATVVANTLTLITTYTNGYHLLVVEKPTGGTLTGTLALRTPSAADKVPAYNAGDTVIAVITHTGSAPFIQYLTYDKVSNHVSLAYDNGASVYTEVGTIKASALGVDLKVTVGNLTIENEADNLDIIFKGTDGGTDITALTLDMSDAGKAIFTNDVQAAGRTLTQNTITNNGNNRVLTATTNAYEHNAEATLTFDGTTLVNTGSYTATGGVDVNLAVNAGTSLSSATATTVGTVLTANQGVATNGYYKQSAPELLDDNLGRWAITGDYSYIFISHMAQAPDGSSATANALVLPSAAAVINRILTIKNIGPVAIIITPQGGENFDMDVSTGPANPSNYTLGSSVLSGVNTITLHPLQSVTLWAAGAEGQMPPPLAAGWYIMQSSSN